MSTAVPRFMYVSESYKFCVPERKGYVNFQSLGRERDSSSIFGFQVKLQLPDSLPSPHEAPFWMKVGEAGEAFFVVETDEEVPEELQTSPVMSATDVSPPVSPDFSGREGEGPDGKNNLSATQEPFGRGQGGISITNSPGALQPVSLECYLTNFSVLKLL